MTGTHPHEYQPDRPGAYLLLDSKRPRVTEFKAQFGHPTDTDAVWRARELRQDDQECLTRIADNDRRAKRITS